MSTTAAAGLDHATLLEQFRGDGFAVARGVLDRDRLARLRALGDGLFEDAAAREAGRHGFPLSSRACTSCIRSSPRSRRTSRCTR